MSHVRILVWLRLFIIRDSGCLYKEKNLQGSSKKLTDCSCSRKKSLYIGCAQPLFLYPVASYINGKVNWLAILYTD